MADARRRRNLPASSIPRPVTENDAPPAQSRLYIDDRGVLRARWPRESAAPHSAPPSDLVASAGPSAGPSRSATSIRSARKRANVLFDPPDAPQDAQPAPAPVLAAPVLAAPVPAPRSLGYRSPRRHPLTDISLYNDEARPPILAIPKPHHVCSICLAVKSHPVSYACGHSHCYVCVRLWLEKGWGCPDCTQEMYMPPFRHYGEEKSILYDYPFWIDDSRVSYSFDGLDFPSPPPRRVVLDLTDAP